MNTVSDKITKENCEDCLKVRCRRCSWEANNEEVSLIQKEILTSCPKCGWKP